MPHFLYTEEKVPQQHDGACHFRCISKDIYLTSFNKVH